MLTRSCPSPPRVLRAASRRYVWGRNGGMRGWKSTKSSVHSYRNQQINGGIHGLAPYPWNRRDQKHGKIVVKSPSFCYPSKIVFKMQVCDACGSTRLPPTPRAPHSSSTL